jgi:hypothetical protein
VSDEPTQRERWLREQLDRVISERDRLLDGKPVNLVRSPYALHCDAYQCESAIGAVGVIAVTDGVDDAGIEAGLEMLAITLGWQVMAIGDVRRKHYCPNCKGKVSNG